MQFFTKQINQYETVAEVLSAARRDGEFDLDRAEKVLKINRRYLVAIETGQYDQLPGDIYIRSFVRAYAQWLQVDVKQTLALLDRELEITRNIETPVAPETPGQYLSSRVLVTPQRIRYAALILAGLVCVGYLIWQINTIFAPPPLTVTQPTADLVTTETIIMVTGQTEPEVAVTINGQALLTDPAGQFQKQIDLQTGVNVIEVTAQKKRSRPQTVRRQVIVEEAAARPPIGGELIELPSSSAP
ncbi:MAG: helix-turn-helix domain-containing protein [Patescibacteria group bacterium]